MERTYTTPLIDKLGVRPGARVALVGIDDAVFGALLRERTTEVEAWRPGAATVRAGVAEQVDPVGRVDLVFLAADSQAELADLPALRAAIAQDGAIWVVSRKGRAATLRDVEVVAAARASGLVDNKVASFSATHTALRLVIPRALRAR